MAVFGPVPSQGKDFVVNQSLRPFEFSGELNLGCRHFCEYVPNARISRSARRFGAVQRAYPAIQRVGHPGLALREVLGNAHFTSRRQAVLVGGTCHREAPGPAVSVAGGADWIKVKNPSAPAATS